MNTRKILLTSSLLTTMITSAYSQWTVSSLHPSLTASSFGYGGSGINQVGESKVSGVFHASLWSGNAGSWVDLNPLTASRSSAYSTFEGSHVGEVVVSGVRRAYLWNGNISTGVDLHPAGASESVAYGVSGSNQVGGARISGILRAKLWSGSVASSVDLHPAVSTESLIYGSSGANQVGYARVGGILHASLWSGNVGSWVDLHPTQVVSASHSTANGVSGGKQVGSVTLGGEKRASLWSNTPASWVNLNPVTSSASEAFGVLGNVQVGYIVIGGREHACLWTGSAASVVDLHATVTPGYQDSTAKSISKDSANYIISGYGYRLLTSRYEALSWTQPIRKITGNLALLDTAGTGDPGTETINWTLTSGANTFSGSVIVNHFGGGTYSIDIPIGAANGTYDLRFKGGTFLSSTYPLNLNGTNLSQSVSLRNGDIDQDGYVGFDDFDILSANFGNAGNNAPGSADLDNDSFVGFDDFDILSANFGLSDE